jgi:hypothetical protein
VREGFCLLYLLGQFQIEIGGPILQSLYLTHLLLYELPVLRTIPKEFLMVFEVLHFIILFFKFCRRHDNLRHALDLINVIGQIPGSSPGLGNSLE